MGKFKTARWVLAPYRASAGTGISPMLSFSVRVFMIVNQAASRLRKKKHTAPSTRNTMASRIPVIIAALGLAKMKRNAM